MALAFPLSVPLNVEASSKVWPCASMAAIEWAGGDCRIPTRSGVGGDCIACGEATGILATAEGETAFSIKIFLLAWVELVDLAAWEGVDGCVLALEIVLWLAVDVALVLAATGGGDFWMAPMTWARTREVELADLPVALDLVDTCSSSPLLQVSSFSPSWIRAEGALDCPGLVLVLEECLPLGDMVSLWWWSMGGKSDFSHPGNGCSDEW